MNSKNGSTKMAHITYIDHSGTEHAIEVAIGHSVMEGAIQNSIRGIDADCGGACACATCHVYVDEAWTEKVGSRSAMEDSLLEFANGVQDNSRLSCQIRVTESLDGLVVRLPASQQSQRALHILFVVRVRLDGFVSFRSDRHA